MKKALIKLGFARNQAAEIDRMTGVTENNRNTRPCSAGGALARMQPPILWGQAANGGLLRSGMLMPKFRPWGPDLLNKHKERENLPTVPHMTAPHSHPQVEKIITE